jgi:predicted DNA-binding transcriptional regulator YafY
MHNQHKILRVLQLISLLKKNPPKQISALATLLDNTERTVYRYLDLIKELGFNLQKDISKRYYIEGEAEVEASFTNEEASLLKELILSTGKKNKLRDSLLKKVYQKSEIIFHGENLLQAHLGKMIEKINFAIINDKQIILKNYHSVRSQNISDRKVEPIELSENYDSLCAYELKSGENKYFNLSRISEVEVLKSNTKHKSKHYVIPTDAFGYAENNNPKYDIDLRLSLRAYLLLKEEYPRTLQFIKPEPKTQTYLLKLTVNDALPITRFVMGLLDEVEILGSFDFQEHLLLYVSQLLDKQAGHLKPNLVK